MNSYIKKELTDEFDQLHIQNEQMRTTNEIFKVAPLSVTAPTQAMHQMHTFVNAPINATCRMQTNNIISFPARAHRRNLFLNSANNSLNCNPNTFRNFNQRNIRNKQMQTTNQFPFSATAPTHEMHNMHASVDAPINRDPTLLNPRYTQNEQIPKIAPKPVAAPVFVTGSLYPKASMSNFFVNEQHQINVNGNEIMVLFDKIDIRVVRYFEATKKQIILYNYDSVKGFVIYDVIRKTENGENICMADALFSFEKKPALYKQVFNKFKAANFVVIGEELKP